MPEAISKKEAPAKKDTPVKKDVPPAKDARCMYCGERLRGVPAGDKDSSHPGGPNACIARALLKLRKSLRPLLLKTESRK